MENLYATFTFLKRYVFYHGTEHVETNYQSLWDIPAVRINGEPVERLGQVVEGKKAVLVVNVASKWGVTTKSYQQLVAMHNELSDQGFEILTFPSNQLGGWEPGTNQEVEQF